MTDEKNKGKTAFISIRGIEAIITDYEDHGDHITAKLVMWLDKRRDSILKDRTKGKEIVIRSEATDFYMFI